jgi:hypothetical protein
MKVVQLDSAGKLSTELAFNSIFGIERASFSINRFDATVLQNGYYVDEVLYKKLRHSLLGWSVNIPTSAGRWISKQGYKIANNIIGFN